MKGKRIPPKNYFGATDRKRVLRRTTVWADAILLDFGEWLRVRTSLSGLKGKDAAQRTVALMGKEKPSNSRKLKAKAAKPEPTTSFSPSPEKLRDDANKLIEKVERLKAVYAEEVPKLKKLKQDVDQMGKLIKQARRQAAVEGWDSQVQESERAQRSLASMEDEMARLTRRARVKEDRVGHLQLDIKTYRYEAKMLFNLADRLRRTRDKINSRTPPAATAMSTMAFFDLTLDENDGREILDSVQWSHIENGRDTSLDEFRVRAAVRAISQQNDVEKNMEEARAILDPRRAFAEALFELRRRYGSEFSDCFTKPERKIIYKFKTLRAPRRHLVANFINGIFGTPFGHYEAGVNWISEWLKEVVNPNPAGEKQRVLSSSSFYTHNFGRWLKTMRERSRFTVDEAALLAEAMEGRIDIKSSIGREMSRSSWQRIESDLEANPLRGKQVGRKKARQKKWLEAVVSVVSVDAAHLEIIARWQAREQKGKSVELQKSNDRLKTAGKLVILSGGEPLSQANKHRCLKPEIFGHNMQRARAILDPFGALSDADKAARKEPDKFHPQRFLKRGEYLDYLMLEYDERRIVDDLFHLPAGDQHLSLYHEDESVIAPDVFPFHRNTRRRFLIEYLNLSLHLSHQRNGSRR